MAIYDKPVRSLMREFAKEQLKEVQTFTRADVVRWFARNYPKIKRGTVTAHVDAMAVNSRARKHHSNVKPGSGHDLFYKIDSRTFRLWDSENDPAPIYRDDFRAAPRPGSDHGIDDEYEEYDEDSEYEEDGPSKEFSYERDLSNYLARNLSVIEPGLRLYEDEGLSGIEFPAGGRFIDILALDANDGYVVIELKVSKGYDRVVGQILRYMGWVERNLANGKDVRGIIVASEISGDLKLATSRVPGISLFEYEISFSLKPVDPSG